MSFASGCLTSGSSPLCVLCQLPDGSVWGATPEGRLAHFAGGAFDASLLQTRPDGCLEVLPDRLLAPRSPLGFSVSLLDVNVSGLKALVAGYVGSRPHLAVADLQRETDPKGQLECYTYSYCEGDFIFNRPGMKLRQVSWWPDTDPPSFAVLAGNILAVYQSSSVSVPYATYRLQFSSLSIPSSIADCGNATAFCFAENAKDWAAFAICVMRDDGAVFVLCPVVVPGIPFDKADAIVLLTEGTEEMVQKWHRLVFSRTQLQQNANPVDRTTAIIHTRSLGGDWRHAPALQGPIHTRGRSLERDFHSIVSLKDNKLAFANIKGTVILAKISPIVPLFHDKEIRAGAPHVFVLQDCVRTPSAIEMEMVAETRMPEHDSSMVQLLKRRGHSCLIARTDGYMLQMDCSNVSDAISVLHKNVPGSLGCVVCGFFLLSVRVSAEFELKCSFLQNRPHSLYRSRLSSGMANIPELTDVVPESEENALEKISGLRETLRSAHEETNAFCDAHEQMAEKTTSELAPLHEGIKEWIADGAASVEQGGYESLSQQYKNVLSSICPELEALDPSAIDAPSQLQSIKDRLADLGSGR